MTTLKEMETERDKEVRPVMDRDLTDDEKEKWSGQSLRVDRIASGQFRVCYYTDFSDNLYYVLAEWFFDDPETCKTWCERNCGVKLSEWKGE